VARETLGASELVAELRTHQFYAGTLTTTNWVTCATVPAGHYAILKSAAMHNAGAAARGVVIRLSGVVVQYVSLGAYGSATDDAEWRPWIAVPEGGLMEAALSGGTGSVGLVLSGSLLYI
jgi:hypothetical protein